MTVWECMEMLGRHERVRIFQGNKELTSHRITAYEYEMQPEKFSRELFDTILEKRALTVDLEDLIIYCED